MSNDTRVAGGGDPAVGLSRRKAALATLFGSGANTLIVALQAVALVPLYLNSCGARLYGAWLASGDFLVWMQAFDLGLPNLLIQKAGSALGQGNCAMAGQWFVSGVWFLGSVSLGVGLIGLIASPWVPAVFGLHGVEAAVLSACFALGSLAAGLSLFNNIFVGYSRAIQETIFLNRAMILASLTGFMVSLAALLLGWGLWAVALGLVSRAIICLLASLWFVVFKVPAELRGTWRPDRGILLEYLRVLPATATGGIAYALMNQSETALIAVFTRPELAAVYNLTRKAIEVARSLVDTLAFAAYGGFAHLVASAPASHVRKVYGEIRAARVAPAIAAACAYLVVNPSLVGKWVGPSLFGGRFLSLLIALQFIVAGEAFLVNYLFRASGQVERGSWLLGLEAVFRVSLMVLGLVCIGVSGVPVATLVVCVPFTILVHKRVLAAFPAEAGDPALPAFGWIHGLGLGFLGTAFTVSYRMPPLGWSGILVCGSLTGLLVGVTLVACSPELRPMIRIVASRMLPARKRTP